MEESVVKQKANEGKYCNKTTQYLFYKGENNYILNFNEKI